MRRPLAIVLGTLTGGALLVGAKLGTASASASTDASDTAGAVAVTGDSSASPAPNQSVKPTPKASGAKSSASAKPGTSNSPSSTKTTSKPTTPPPTSGFKDGTYSATATVADGKGTLSMTATISGGKITDIKASETNPTEPNCWHSACPTLRSEALSAQSTSIHSVSGATLTSNAYRSSLQAILNKAKA